MIKRIMKIKNRILAIDAAPAAMPPKPKTAAIKAIIRNEIDHLNIIENSLVLKIF
jgi:hypothetical protein